MQSRKLPPMARHSAQTTQSAQKPKSRPQQRSVCGTRLGVTLDQRLDAAQTRDPAQTLKPEEAHPRVNPPASLGHHPDPSEPSEPSEPSDLENDAVSVAKGGPGRRRSETSHQAILQAAAALLLELGYVGMSIEAIARRAGVGKQTIYRWWPSKAEVVLEVYGELVSQSSAEPDTGSVQRDLVAWIDQMATLLATSASAQALAGIMAEAQADPVLAQKFRDQIITGRRRVVCDILQRGIQRGELRDDLNLALAADLIYGPIWYRLLLSGEVPNRQFAEQLVDQLLLGLQAFDEEG